METITELSQLDMSKQYTYADYLTWWFDERVELIKGYVRRMAPAPSRLHQKVGLKLVKHIANFLDEKPCELYYAPFDVRLQQTLRDEEAITVVQPDICVVCDPTQLDDRGCNGAPSLIIEILSLYNSKHDVDTKYNLYQEAGVQEYWIVSPSDKTVNVFVLTDGVYNLIKLYAEDALVPVNTLPGLVINMKTIFNY